MKPPRACGAEAAQPGDEVARDVGERPPLQFRLRIHRHHARRVDAAFQRRDGAPGHGCSLLEVEPVQQHCVVAREVVRVVLQDAQVQRLDLRVGRIDVHHLDATGGQRLVGDAVVDAHRALRQPVVAREPRPAVGAADELVRQAQHQVRVRRQVADARDGLAARGFIAHRQRIAVLEAQRHRHAQPQRAELAAHRGEVGGLCVAQDLGVDRAQVLGIQVDGAGFERLVDDRGVAQARPVLGLRTARAGRLRHDLAQDVGLGEALGAHHESLAAQGGAAGSRRQREPEGQQDQTHREGRPCEGPMQRRDRRILPVGFADASHAARLQRRARIALLRSARCRKF
jgi:hypothetical protein